MLSCEEELVEELRLSAWRMWSESTEERRLEIVNAAARLQRWSGGLRSWRSSVSKWLSPDRRHPLPALLLVVLACRTGREEWAGTFMRAAMSHRRMRKVRPNQPGARRHG